MILEAARHFHIEKAIADGVAIEEEIELFASDSAVIDLEEKRRGLRQSLQPIIRREVT